jgi:hypothetical protein
MRPPDDPIAILMWLDRNALRIEFQQLDAQVPRKRNKVLLQYRDASSGVIQAVSGRTLSNPVSNPLLAPNRL